LVNDGTNTYHWDAENRLIQINYPGSNNYSAFTYDGIGLVAQIVETTGGTVTSTKQFVWCENERCEAKNSDGSTAAQYFKFGQTIGGIDYFYSRDSLGSIRELTDSSGTIQSKYSYDAYGQVAQQGSVTSDFQFAGYYFHAPSQLYLAVHRQYSAKFGRWISRDPIEEKGGIYLYSYVNNIPTGRVDPSGLFVIPLAWLLAEFTYDILAGGFIGVGIGIGLSPRRIAPPNPDQFYDCDLTKSQDCCETNGNLCRALCERVYPSKKVPCANQDCRNRCNDAEKRCGQQSGPFRVDEWRKAVGLQ
jgi:RHS repeat-associated protein